MRHALRISLLFVVIAFAHVLRAQNCPGVPGACGYTNNNPNTNTPSIGPQSPTNGNGTLGVIYDQQLCGLDFTSASQRLGRRGSLNGVIQPAPFAIAGVPASATIVKAYLWAEGSGNGAAQTATINGPAGTFNFPMAIVGQGPDKCWGYAGSYTYRADVTAAVNGNGTYNISGILTNPPTAGNDMDGATLLVIWSDASQAWAGRIVIADGAKVVNGGTYTYNMPLSPAACSSSTPTNARAFLGVGDIQFNPNSWSANSTPIPLSWNWWNFMTVNTTVASGATNSSFNIATSGDCYNMCITGLYFRTTCCMACASSALTVTPASTPATCSNCNGTGSVSVSPAGSYTYSWSPGGYTTASVTNLCPGNYTVTITQTPCISYTQLVTVANNSSGITVTNSSSTNVSCFGGTNGSATAVASGGVGPYTFTWTPVVSNTTSGNSNTATGLGQGTYVVTSTDANGCTGQQTFTITQPAQLTSSALVGSPSCFGGSNASANITASGGTGPFTFTWSPSASNTTSGSTNTGTGLSAIPYSILITDANGCSTTQNITVTQPTQLTATATAIASSCNQSNGSVSVASSGGTGSPTVSWMPGSYTTTTVSNLASGTYTVTVTDANGCSVVDSASIAPSVNMTATTSWTDLLCYQDNSGTASVTVAGNTGTVTYTWTPSVSTTNSATGLAAGTYVVDASDPNGCSTSSTITITEPPQLTTAVGGFNVSCFGACDGQIVVIPTGGTGTYTFAWSTGCTQPSCNTICAGNYNVTVTDQNGCSSSGSTSVTEPAQIVVTTSFDTAHCNQADGAAYASAVGGTGTLQFNWTPGNIANDSLLNVQGGPYDVVVTDANGCADTVTVNVINQPGVVATMGTLTMVSCFGGNDGTATGLFTGGNGPYTYNWNTNPVQTNSTATGLAAGNYMVTATDADGCTSTANATITEPPQLTVAATSTPSVVCAGQPVTLNAVPAGGTPTYTVTWQPLNQTGATQTTIPQATGTYTADIVDQNGCTATTTTSVTVNPIPSAAFISDSLSGCAPLCVNFSDLSTVATGTITGWAWDFGDQSPIDLTQSPAHCYTTAGVYTVSLAITSNGGCTSTLTMNNYIDVYGIPTAAFTASPQPTTILNPEIFFTDQSTGAASWSWSFGDMVPASTSTLQNPSFTYPTSGCFDVVLEVASVTACIDTTVEQVCIDPDVAIYVPNAFTPNGDGVNDLFFAQGIGIDPDKFELWIFDRWGNLIFYTDDMNEGWNGCVQGSSNLCQIDTYVWKIKCVDLLDKKHNLIGDVNLIR